MTICIIPARSGSKRIKNKNIQKIGNKHLIGIVIRIARLSRIFKRIIVSTDSIKIAKIAKNYGAEVPFLRNKKLSNDYAPTYEVLIDCIKKIGSEKTPYHFCIYPTSIFMDKGDLKRAFKRIKKTKSNFICPIQKFDSPPQKSFHIKKNSIYYNWPKYQMYRSQDQESYYYDTGSFYIYKTNALLKIKPNKLLPPKSTYYFFDKISVDIDTPEDLKKAKLIFNLNKKKR
jgi:pseudaminic acid cytidylyltransferase